MSEIKFDDFKKLEIKIAKILEVNNHPNADKLYVMKIDLGNEQKQVVAGIKSCYAPAELVNLPIAVVTNLEPAIIRGVESQAMLLTAQDENGISVLTCHRSVKIGSIIK